MQSCKQGMWKGHYFSTEGIRNGCLFCRKMAYKRGKGLNLGAEPPPDKTFLSTPGLGFHQSAINSGNGAAWGSNGMVSYHENISSRAFFEIVFHFDWIK